jgi:hypothetical protein
MEERIIIDILVVLVSFVFYGFLSVVFLLRAYGRDKLELMLAPWFSVLLVPFISLFVANVHAGDDFARLVTLVPILIFLVYDLWYRLLSQKKPVHHPDRWPVGLVVYLVLLQVGCIGVNWYGFLVSKLYGDMLIVSFFIMLGCFGFYQYRLKKMRGKGSLL